MFFLSFLRRLWQALMNFGSRNDFGWVAELLLLRFKAYCVLLRIALCSMTNLTGKIRNENLSGGGRSADVYKATYSTGSTSRQVCAELPDDGYPPHSRKNRSPWSRWGYLFLTTQSNLKARLVIVARFLEHSLQCFARNYWSKPMPGPPFNTTIFLPLWVTLMGLGRFYLLYTSGCMAEH